MAVQVEKHGASVTEKSATGGGEEAGIAAVDSL
jgi:hypothetical protein